MLEDSKLDTVAVPIIGANNPSILYRAADKVLRIVVRNVGGAPVLLAHESSALQVLGGGGTYLLPQGDSDVFVLMPKQSILAGAIGIAGQVSIAVSVAIPTVSTEG
jgi:hypothetical protein